MPMKSLVLVALALAGCITDMDDPNEDSVDQSVTSSNKLASNKLASNKLASNALAASKLALTSVSTGTAAAALINTADGREVLSYIVSCALTSAQSITLKDSTGVSYAFPGSLGLGSAWLTRALTLDEQQWVSSCVFSRTNYFGVAVQLSMRGNNTLLATTSDERTAYPNFDGTFYGNLFDTTGPKEYACKGTYNASLRVCANSTDGVTTECGFTYTGLCSAACVGTLGAGATATAVCRNANTTAGSTAVYANTTMVYLLPGS